MEGHYSSTTPFINRSTFSRVRWRNDFNEYQCDECYNVIKSTYPADHDEEEGEVETLDELDEVEDYEEPSTLPVRPIE